MLKADRKHWSESLCLVPYHEPGQIDCRGIARLSRTNRQFALIRRKQQVSRATEISSDHDNSISPLATLLAPFRAGLRFTTTPSA